MAPFAATKTLNCVTVIKLRRGMYYFLFSTTVVLGRRLAVAWVTKCPVIADRGLPPEDPFFLLT